MAMPPTPLMPANSFEVPTIVADIRYGLSVAAAGIDDIARNIDSHLSQLPDFLADDLRAELARLRQLADTAIRDVSDQLAYAGDPAVLRAAGAMWATDIGGAASRHGGLATLNGIRADDHWTGMAADAYRNTLPPQLAALTAIKATADELDSTLNDLANSILTYWVSISQATLSLVGGVTTAVLSAAGVLTALAGIGIGIAALSAFTNTAGAAHTALTDITNNTASRAAELERRLYNDIAFADGTWPRSTTPISTDASTSDGDDSTWQLR